MQILSLKELKEHMELSEDESSFSEENSLPVLISDYVERLLNHEEIRRQFVPTKFENEDTLGFEDPQNEKNHSDLKRVIHRYENRVAIITSERCFSYCRHCFRRRLTGRNLEVISKKEIDEIAEYLKNHLEIKEALLTGGDLFTLSDERLEYLLGSFKNARKDIIFRLCTRALFTNPERFTDTLFKVLEKNSSGAPYYLMTQFNSAIEITEEAESILERFSSLRVPIMNQSVLLRDVNDSLEHQRELSEKLLRNRVKPYYLFQGDLVKGTRHLRVPLSKTLELEEEMRKNLSGLEMPEVMIDLPEGGGKLILSKCRFCKKEDGTWIFKSLDGRSIEYPEDL